MRYTFKRRRFSASGHDKHPFADVLSFYYRMGEDNAQKVKETKVIKPKEGKIVIKAPLRQPKVSRTVKVKNDLPNKKIVYDKPKEVVKPVEIKQKALEYYPKPLFSNINLTSVSEKLDKLFDTPVEQRSSHLVHEKLPTGRIFSGRVSFTASDGAQVSVSRVKSPRYVDFVYYSIKVQNGNTHYAMNLDPDACLILESTPEGKVIIDKRQRVKHLSKKEFLEQNPQAENLAVYLNELFDFHSGGEKKVVKSNLKMKGLTLKEREKEVLKALGQAAEIPLDSFYKF